MLLFVLKSPFLIGFAENLYFDIFSNKISSVDLVVLPLIKFIYCFLILLQVPLMIFSFEQD